jgi:hypothetical protein
MSPQNQAPDASSVDEDVIHAFIAELAVAFAQPGHAYMDRTGDDNYFEAGADWIADRLQQQGHDPDDHRDEIAAALDDARNAPDTTIRPECEGRKGQDVVARAYHRWRRRPVLRSREGVRRHGQRLSTPPTSTPRVRSGRARRPACNQRTSGSRRSGSGSRAGPDDGDGESDPPGVSTPPAGRETAETTALIGGR